VILLNTGKVQEHHQINKKYSLKGHPSSAEMW